MKSVKINPSILEGKIKIPPSKSISHRAIICAGLSDGESRISNIAFSDDIIATIEGMKSFGVKMDIDDQAGTVKVIGKGKLKVTNDSIDCKESGSTLRFLIPMAGLVEEKVRFDGRGKLVERPLDSYYKVFERQNIKYENDDGKLPLCVEGILKPDVFKIKGNISSQFITGLLFVLPLLKENSKIIITTELESKGYVDLTIDALKHFGIEVENDQYKEFFIKGNQKYKPTDYSVEGDFSQAAFWIVAGLLCGGIKCSDLNINSIQGDKEVLDIVKRMGADLIIDRDHIKINKSSTKGIVIDASQCPDLVPILAVLGVFSEGTTRIVNAKRLRIKESDRLKAIRTELNKLGADIEELEDGLIIKGKEKLRGGVVDSWNDHRIAMALAVASIKCSGPVTIKNSDCVKKSYPSFWDDFIALGGDIDERNMGR